MNFKSSSYFNTVRRREEFFATEHLKSGIKKRSVRGGAIMLVVQAGKFFLQLSSTFVLARLLTPSDFGFIAMAAVVTGFVNLFKDMGLSMATVQKVEVTHAQVSTLFWINLGVVIALALGTAAIAPLVEWLYGEPGLTLVTIVLGSVIIFAGLSVQHQALLQRQMRYMSLGFIDLTSMFIGIVVGVVFAWHGAGYWALVAMTGATAASNAVLVWSVCSWRPGLPNRRSGVRSMLVFGGNLTGFNLINFFSRNADNALIGWWWGSGPLGLYSKAYGILMLPMRQITVPLSQVAIPVLSRLHDDPERYRRTYLRVVQKIALVAVPLVAFLFVTSDWVIEVVLGPQWTQAARIFAWLSIAAVTQPISSTAGWLFVTQGRTKELFLIGLFSGVLIVTSFVVGLPWGPVGVAASYSISGALVRLPILFWYIGRRGPVRASDLYASLVLPLFVGASVAGAVALTRWLLDTQNSLTGILAAGFVAAVTMVICLVSLPIGRDTLNDFKDLLVTGLKR